MLFIAHMWVPPFCFSRSNAVFMLLLCSRIIAHMWVPPYRFSRSNAVFMLLLCCLSLTCGCRHFVLVVATQCLCCCPDVYRSHCGRRHIEFNVQRSAYVVAMFAYYRSHVGGAILNIVWQCSVYVWAPPFCSLHTQTPEINTYEIQWTRFIYFSSAYRVSASYETLETFISLNWPRAVQQGRS